MMRSPFKPPALAAGTLSLSWLVVPAAQAHHMMDGKLPGTFMQGLLSGLGHPVIGIDHLAFVLATGLAVACAGLPLLLPALFVALSAVGVALHVAGADLVGAEPVIALSVLLAGGLIASGRRLPVAAWALLFAVAGLFHGYAYGESIYGAEPTPILAYLLGLVVIQSGLAIGLAALLRGRAAWVRGSLPRLAGGAVAAVGLLVVATQMGV